MSELNSINGGYKGGSPRVRSENSKKQITPIPKIIDAQELSSSIKKWYSDGKISPEGLKLITSQLQELCKITSNSYEDSIVTLNDQLTTLDTQISDKQTTIATLSKEENIVETINALKEFFGDDKIEEIKNLIKNKK
jgi:hypothetical protein|tara:strand:+ start:1638 stop:2048 length:411 start_codon:yes stop_codon:yes gene_type:complete